MEPDPRHDAALAPDAVTAEDEHARHGALLTEISNGMVRLLKEHYGRGPTRAKSYFQDDLVVCVMRGGFSRVEQTLLDGGRGAAVIQQRMEFQELMRDRFCAIVTRSPAARSSAS